MEININAGLKDLMLWAQRILADQSASSPDRQLQAQYSASVIQVVLTRHLTETIGRLDEHLQQASQMLLDAANAAEQTENNRHAANVEQSRSLGRATWFLFGANLVMAAAVIAQVYVSMK